MPVRTPTPTLDADLADLLKTVQGDDAALLRRAFDFAAEAHEGQLRKNGELYITHPLTVARLLADLRMDPPTLAAGLLHDVLEDNLKISHGDLKNRFGPEIADLVQGVTKLSKIHFTTKGEEQGANLRKLILAMARDIRVIVIKLCDRLHNMRTLQHLPHERRIGISRDTMAIYAPLAHRLGMTRIKSELEDLAMMWLHPDDFQAIDQAVNRRRHERDKVIEDTKEFLGLYLRTHYKDLEIQGRPKHYFSIWRKMRDQGLTFDEIYDLNALRIICNSVDECYGILGLIHSIWPPIPNRFKDYIGMPKPNMYQSIHTTVVGLRGEVTEIQIRTRKMHEIAEEGIAAHWRYKEGVRNDYELNKKLKWLRQLMDWITELEKPTDFLDAVKQDVFSDVVLCFTPKSDLIDLPAGATPIDFAYAVHSKVGDHCVGARVNRRQVPLGATLQTGDIVEIQTQHAGHPSRDWLDIVATGRARSKIKHWLKEKEFDIWATAGREQVMRELKNRGLDLSKELLYKALENVVEPLKLNSVDDLFCEIGFGTLSPGKTFNKALNHWVSKGREALDRELHDLPEEFSRRELSRLVRTVLPGSRLSTVEDMYCLIGLGKLDAVKIGRQVRAQLEAEAAAAGQTAAAVGSRIIIEGGTGIPVRHALCCEPQPGDPIVGFITRGRGVTVHKTTCKSILRLREAGPEEQRRLLPARWGAARAAEPKTKRDKPKVEKLRLTAKDHVGLLHEIASQITQSGLNIVGSHSHSKLAQGTAHMGFSIEVKDIEKLRSVVEEIRANPDVLDVEIYDRARKRRESKGKKGARKTGNAK